MTDAAKAEAADRGDLPELTRGDGPWSFADAPADQRFIAFGALKLPGLETMKARVEVDEKSKRVGAVSVLVDECMVQIQVLAAPRGGTIWPDVRRAITQRIAGLQGSSQAVEGDFGTELIVTLPVPTPGGMPGAETSRYVGIEGDRWLIRAVVMGPKGLEDGTVAKVNALLSRCAVDRGDAAMSPGSVMELELPSGELQEESTVAKLEAQREAEES